VTDAMLREAWTAALTRRGRRDAILDRINEIVDEAKRMPDQERQRQRRIALAMLHEVRPHWSRFLQARDDRKPVALRRLTFQHGMLAPQPADLGLERRSPPTACTYAVGSGAIATPGTERQIGRKNSTEVQWSKRSSSRCGPEDDPLFRWYQPVSPDPRPTWGETRQTPRAVCAPEGVDALLRSAVFLEVAPRA
jgi:hypothetical protein